MIKQPDQQIHDEIIKVIRSLKYDVYTYLPDKKARYPFIVMGDIMLLPKPTKSVLIGRVAVTLHIWADINNRKRISDMTTSILYEISKIKEIGNTKWYMQLDSTSHINVDNSTSESLYHGVIDVSFKFI